MRPILIIPLLVGIAGCSAAPGILPLSDPYSRFNPDIAERFEICDREHRQSSGANFSERAKCQNSAIDDIFGKANYPNMDLLSGYQGKNLKIAQMIDAHQVTETEGANLAKDNADRTAAAIDDLSVELSARLSCFRDGVRRTEIVPSETPPVTGQVPCRAYASNPHIKTSE